MSAADLPDTDPHCRQCRNFTAKARWKRSDLQGARRRLRSARGGAEAVEQVRLCVELADEAEGALYDHLEREHPEGVERVRVDRAFKVVEPEVIPEGSGKCRACGFIGVLTSAGNLRRHVSAKSRDHFPCANKMPEGLQRVRVEAPPVQIRAGSSYTPGDKSEPSRLDVGSHCRECNKWLPGERSLCGRCYARQGKSA